MLPGGWWGGVDMLPGGVDLLPDGVDMLPDGVDTADSACRSSVGSQPQSLHIHAAFPRGKGAATVPRYPVTVGFLFFPLCAVFFVFPYQYNNIKRDSALIYM